jgi:dTDP-4-amino-4,6-dideoxygalactose transaminase
MPIVDEPFPQPKRWGAIELARLTAMVDQKSLFYVRGPQTAALLEGFRRLYPLEFCFTTSSGSAALHVAVASLRLRPGDEIIVPPITDMGSVIGILYQQLVPVFADVDPHTYNLDPADVRRRITAKTRAIMPVHLAGNPCDLNAIMAIAREHQLKVIEDCAQAWGAKYQGKPVGLFGDLACYSFNEFKHLSCGDGGIVGTNDRALGPGLSRWGDKFYDRVTNNRNPEELAPNYRMTEPQAAVAAAQIERHDAIIGPRARAGAQLAAALAGVPGLGLPQVRSGDTATFWFYVIRLDAAYFNCTRDEFVAALNTEGVVCVGGCIPKPVYRYPLFQNHNFFGGAWPIRDCGLTKMDYREVICPHAAAILNDSITVTLNEAMKPTYVEKVAAAIRTVAKRQAR